MSFISFPRQATTFSDLGPICMHLPIWYSIYITIIFFVQNRTRQYFEWIIRTNAQGSSRFKFQDNLTKHTGVLRTYSDFYQIHVYIIGSQCLYLWNNLYSKRNHPPLTSQLQLYILFADVFNVAATQLHLMWWKCWRVGSTGGHRMEKLQSKRWHLRM